MTSRPVIIIMLSAILFSSCRNDRNSTERAFYYWKTVFKITNSEKEYLSRLSVSKLYIRFFDITWDPETSDFLPVGEILFRDSIPKGISVVPVIFITNIALRKSGSSELKNLSNRIIAKVDRICRENLFIISELQIDCDWSESTRYKYFVLLEEIKSELHKRKITLSTTIRLHQIKYYKITGVPPADKGMLMYYNMGKLDAESLRNSIYNSKDANLYNDYIKSYPLELDTVLPIFNLVIQMRRGRIIELINKSFINDLYNDIRFRKLIGNNFAADESFFLHGTYFMKGDIIKIENVSAEELLGAANVLSGQLRKEKRTVSLFDLDSLNLRQYNEEDIKKVFDCFR